jgi:hypothetical protein
MNEKPGILETANNIYFEEVENEDGMQLNLEEQLRTNLAGIIESRFADSEMARDADENRWITAYHNFRGVYPKHVQFRENEKSRVFIKITKTKVLAAYGQLIDVIFGTGKFPIGVAETLIPEGISEYIHLKNEAAPGIETAVAPEAQEQKDEETTNPFDVGYAGDGKVLLPGATYGKGKFVDALIEENPERFEEGANADPQVLEVAPAKSAARQMEKLIHDQIDESSGSSEMRNALFEASLFGTGIIKGPFNFNKTLHRWTKDEESGERSYDPLFVRVPRIEFVSIWDFFPDPNATNIEECEYVIHRHKMNRSQLRALGKMPYFNKDEIRTCLTLRPNYVEKDYEYELKDDQRMSDLGSSKFEVLEYWGVMDGEYAREVGMDLPEDVDDLDEVQINAWVCNGRVLRAVVNPFTPARIPYQAFPYEKNKFRQLADEQTGIPSYSHGQTGVQSMTRTASGMSMLLGAASLNIKTVVKNIDDFLLKPLGQAYFQWNMQFFEGKLGTEGDLEIKAMGTNSLMQKEVRSQRLTMFLQTAQNPAIAPFVKMSKLISELAYSLDLDPEEILNDPEEAAIAAQIIGMQNNVGQELSPEAFAAGQQPGAMGGPQGAPEQPQDLGVTGTGGGNIGTGSVPQAGESEFSGQPS